MSLNKKSSIGVMLGQPGSGKSWTATRYLVDEFLPNKKGMFLTNVPVNVEAIADYVSYRDDCDPEDVLERIHVIPRHLVKEWQSGAGDFDEYFDQLWVRICDAENLDPDDPEAIKHRHPLSGACVMLDEAKKFLPRSPEKYQKPFVERVFKWLATVRHEGCRVIFIAQTDDQLHKELMSLAGFRIDLSNLGDLPLPRVGIRADTVFQFWAKLGFHYWQWVQEEEFVTISRKPELTKSRRWFLSPHYFQFYDSTDKEDGTSGHEQVPEYIEFGWPRFLLWVIKENFWGLAYALGVFLLAFVFVWPVGLLWTIWSWAMLELPKLITPDFQAAATAPKDPGQGGTTPGRGTPELVKQNETMRLTLKEMAVKLADLEAMNQRYEEQAESASQITLIDKSGVILSNGDRVNVGERVAVGPFQGRRVESVDPRGRLAVLDDGKQLRLRSSIFTEPEQPEQIQPAALVAERQRPEPTPAARPVVPRPLRTSEPVNEGWYSVRGASPRQSRPADPVILVPVD